MQLQERIGARIVNGGCFFRVFAPHARALAVVVQYGPYWEVTDTVIRQDLVKQGDYWTGTVNGVRPWQMYRFEMTLGTGSTSQRLDPAGRDVVDSMLTRNDPSSRNGSIVLGSDLVQWTPFSTPAFENFIVYQFHVGTFAGRRDQFNKGWASFADIESKLTKTKGSGVFSRSSRRKGRADVRLISSLLPQRASRDFR
jgi:1,4-alpha-glucan branching enzyme